VRGSDGSTVAVTVTVPAAPATGKPPVAGHPTATGHHQPVPPTHLAFTGAPLDLLTAVGVALTTAGAVLASRVRKRVGLSRQETS
jgi:hypothetical protein